MGFPGVKIAAVIGVPHPKCEERPILVIEPHDDAAIAIDAVMEHLAGHVARWWLPDAIHVEAIPLTATGKIDKKQLRQRFASAS